MHQLEQGGAEPLESSQLYGDAKTTLNPLDRTKKRRKLEEAEQAYEEDPDNLRNVLNYADALFDVGQLDEAEELLEEVDAEHAENIEVIYNLGYIYLKLDRKEDAVEQFTRVIKQDEDHPLAKSAEYELWTMDPENRPHFLKQRKQQG